MTGPPGGGGGNGGRAGGLGERCAELHRPAPLRSALPRSAPRTPEGPPAGGARPAAEGKARAEPARAAPGFLSATRGPRLSPLRAAEAPGGMASPPPANGGL